MNNAMRRNISCGVIALVFFLFLFGTSHSQELTPEAKLNADPHWTKWDDNKDTSVLWEVKDDSLNFIKSDAGDPYFAVLYRSSKNTDTPRVYTLHMLLVSWKDCVAGLGSLVILTAGEEKLIVLFDEHKGTRAASAARDICLSGAEALNKIEEAKKNPKINT